jgi:RNA polymerase sigma-70 factor (ECF subfamily)
VSPDRALIDRAMGGDAEALNGLVATHRVAAYRIAAAILGEPDAAEDVAQDVAVRLTAALPGFGGGGDLERWVYRVTVNRCRDVLRHRQRRSRDVPIDSAPRHPELAAEERPDLAVDIERARAAVTQAMDLLSDDQKEVLTLRYVTGLPYAEIARITATPQGTIASRVFRALRRLGEQLDPRHLEVLE